MDEVEGTPRRRVAGATSCSRTSTLGPARRPAHARSMSVASTCPCGPTRPARWRSTDVPPAPTSQQRQPGASPSRSRWRKVEGSKSAAKAVKRSIASGASLERRYRSGLTAGPGRSARVRPALRAAGAAVRAGAGAGRGRDMARRGTRRDARATSGGREAMAVARRRRRCGAQVVRGPGIAVEDVGHLGPPLLDERGRRREVPVLPRRIAAAAEDDHLHARRQRGQLADEASVHGHEERGERRLGRAPRGRRVVVQRPAQQDVDARRSPRRGPG